MSETQKEEEIGIPNVPALIWAAELERNKELLAKGYCPIHYSRMVENDFDCTNEAEYYRGRECPYCERGE